MRFQFCTMSCFKLWRPGYFLYIYKKRYDNKEFSTSKVTKRKKEPKKQSWNRKQKGKLIKRSVRMPRMDPSRGNGNFRFPPSAMNTTIRSRHRKQLKQYRFEQRGPWENLLKNVTIINFLYILLIIHQCANIICEPPLMCCLVSGNLKLG